MELHVKFLRCWSLFNSDEIKKDLNPFIHYVPEDCRVLRICAAYTLRRTEPRRKHGDLNHIDVGFKDIPVLKITVGYAVVYRMFRIYSF